jgi:hypothetical protein
VDRLWTRLGQKWTRLDTFEKHRKPYFPIESLDRLDRLDMFFRHTKNLNTKKVSQYMYIQNNRERAKNVSNVSNVSIYTEWGHVGLAKNVSTNVSAGHQNVSTVAVAR